MLAVFRRSFYVAFGDDVAGYDVRPVLPALVLGDVHLYGVRHFIAEQVEHGLANELGHEEPLRVLGQLVARVEGRAQGRPLQRLPQEGVDVVPRGGRDRDHRLERPDRHVGFGGGNRAGHVAEQIRLGEDQDGRSVADALERVAGVP